MSQALQGLRATIDELDRTPFGEMEKKFDQMAVDCEQALHHVRELREALADLLWLKKRDDENYNDLFERVGDRFYQECGMLRPGKHQADALCGTPTDEERQERFDVWIAAFYERGAQALQWREEARESA